MALDSKDLQAIEGLIIKHLAPIHEDIKAIKKDVSDLANLNQLDAVRKDARLRKLYTSSEEQEEA